MKSTTLLLAIGATAFVLLGFKVNGSVGQTRILYVHNRCHQIKTVSNNAVGRTVRDLKRQGYKILRVFKASVKPAIPKKIKR